jgi:hypothetical protein
MTARDGDEMPADDEAVLLHTDDCPYTLHLLAVLLGRRTDRDRLGYHPSEYGAMVDWERLLGAPLSTSEVAVVHIARGCATLERHAGGLPPNLADAVTVTVGAIT